MWSASVDQDRQLLSLRFAERVDVAQANQCAARIRQLLESVRPGFTLLSDLSALTEMDLGCRPVIDAMMDAFNQHEIKRIIRVIPDPAKDIGFGIMSLFHYRKSVRVLTFETLEEAHKLLAK